MWVCVCVQVEELKKKCEEIRKDYEKRKEHMREEAMRRSKALAEDNKHLQRLVSKAMVAMTVTACVQGVACEASREPSTGVRDGVYSSSL